MVKEYNKWLIIATINYSAHENNNLKGYTINIDHILNKLNNHNNASVNVDSV